MLRLVAVLIAAAMSIPTMRPMADASTKATSTLSTIICLSPL